MRERYDPPRIKPPQTSSTGGKEAAATLKTENPGDAASWRPCTSGQSESEEAVAVLESAFHWLAKILASVPQSD